MVMSERYKYAYKVVSLQEVTDFYARGFKGTVIDPIGDCPLYEAWYDPTKEQFIFRLMITEKDSDV